MRPTLLKKNVFLTYAPLQSSFPPPTPPAHFFRFIYSFGVRYYGLFKLFFESNLLLLILNQLMGILFQRMENMAAFTKCLNKMG